MVMQTSVVAIASTEQAKEIHSNFDDLIAWIYELEPPTYPQPIDQEAKDRGQVIFEANCTRCHGTYHEDPAQESYPNLLVSLEIIGTDPHYARYSNESPALSRWLNQGWYAQNDAEGEDSLQAFPLLGYIAPPLDGIWASAPYLHNGSVPNLKSLLKAAYVLVVGKEILIRVPMTLNKWGGLTQYQTKVSFWESPLCMTQLLRVTVNKVIYLLII